MILHPPEAALSEDVLAYARGLFEKRGEGVIVQLAEARIGDWQPRINDCHANVSIWALSQPGYLAVRGWLFFDYAYALPFVQFLAHSVVRTPEGALIDITPQPQALSSYPFLAAAEAEADYAALVEMPPAGRGIGRLWHYL